ncbi:hypothetical protein Trydic_g4037 [Trypoxylus dichotomus]
MPENKEDNTINLIEKDSDYDALAEKYLNVTAEHSCIIIHPYVKWGPQKVKTSSPQCLVDEAVALINSLQTWKVVDKIIVPLDTLQKKTLFGKGTLEKLKNIINRDSSITSVFINTSTLRNIQNEELERHFGKPIFDRYNIVMQIFSLHAISKHAKLQVALAELPFIQSRLRKHDTDFVVSAAVDTRNLILQTREKKIKEEIKQLKSQRELLRYKRTKANFPVVAVVGYTNVGKTSLIKALTGDKSLVPRNQLFATLDVTIHAGLLPSTLKVLYVDTVGFLYDIPTGLIECSNATLEDAILADVILHVEDLSSKNFEHQRIHVFNTLENLSSKMGVTNIQKKLISVGNKCDIADESNKPTLRVSSTTEAGIDVLKHKLEETILKVTDRHLLNISLPIGGDEVRWLYKNATVIGIKEDGENMENNIVTIIISEAKLSQFKYNFVNS